ncbi:peptide MFS transporter [Nonomuraea sp. NPDC052634]|uniref:peptide MFS transporter n=1 Tax=Nonomuraea sp. NPDC052634 TaxID=3155813 RepID=UPI003427BAC1
MMTLRTLLGRRGWFTTLFMTDMWERFSFYGMQAILVLYAVAPPERGGLGLPMATAAALFGVYFGGMFVLALPGGWVGDRLLGERRAILWGGVVITAGHLVMALPTTALTAAGLVLIAAGTGLLKPNLTSLLSRFYRKDQAVQREAAISVFYMSIQVSALAAPLVTGFLGETIDWHLGFGAAAVGMAFGVVRFARGRRYFGEIGAEPVRPATFDERRRAFRAAALVLIPVAVLLTADVAAGAFTPEHVIIPLGLVIVLAAPVAFARLYRSPDFDRGDRRRLGAILWLFLPAALFWMLVGQSGSLLNIFAERHTDRSLFGFVFPASWLQSATPLFVLVVAPVFALVWLHMGTRFGVRGKFVLGMFCTGASFVLMAAAAAAAGQGAVSPLWLLSVFFLHACGELAIGPVGISTASDAAPPAYRGQLIGLWWLFSAMGMGLGSQAARLSEVLPAPVYYAGSGLIALAVAGVLAAFGGRITRTFGYAAAEPAVPHALVEGSRP